jgi:hypothetical protein
LRVSFKNLDWRTNSLLPLVAVFVLVMFARFVFVRMRCGGMRMFVRMLRFAFGVRMLMIRIVVRMLVDVRYFFVRVFVFVFGHNRCSFPL